MKANHFFSRIQYFKRILHMNKKEKFIDNVKIPEAFMWQYSIYNSSVFLSFYITPRFYFGILLELLILDVFNAIKSITA